MPRGCGGGDAAGARQATKAAQEKKLAILERATAENPQNEASTPIPHPPLGLHP